MAFYLLVIGEHNVNRDKFRYILESHKQEDREEWQTKWCVANLCGHRWTCICVRQVIHIHSHNAYTLSRFLSKIYCNRFYRIEYFFSIFFIFFFFWLVGLLRLLHLSLSIVHHHHHHYRHATSNRLQFPIKILFQNTIFRCSFIHSLANTSMHTHTRSKTNQMMECRCDYKICDGEWAKIWTEELMVLLLLL